MTLIPICHCDPSTTVIPDYHKDGCDYFEMLQWRVYGDWPERVMAPTSQWPVHRTVWARTAEHAIHAARHDLEPAHSTRFVGRGRLGRRHYDVDGRWVGVEECVR